MTFQHRAGVRPYASSYDLEQSPVFLINSRLGLFTAAARRSQSKSDHNKRHPFSRSYGVILPSSLNLVLPIALVCSTRPPVSVLVRALGSLPRSFFQKHGMTDFTPMRFVSRLGINEGADFHAPSPYTLSRGRPEPRSAALLRHSIGITTPSGTGI